MAWHLLLQE